MFLLACYKAKTKLSETETKISAWATAARQRESYYWPPVAETSMTFSAGRRLNSLRSATSTMALKLLFEKGAILTGKQLNQHILHSSFHLLLCCLCALNICSSTHKRFALQESWGCMWCIIFNTALFFQWRHWCQKKRKVNTQLIQAWSGSVPIKRENMGESSGAGMYDLH